MEQIHSNQSNKTDEKIINKGNKLSELKEKLKNSSKLSPEERKKLLEAIHEEEKRIIEETQRLIEEADNELIEKEKETIIHETILNNDSNLEDVLAEEGEELNLKNQEEPNPEDLLKPEIQQIYNAIENNTPNPNENLYESKNNSDYNLNSTNQNLTPNNLISQEKQIYSELYQLKKESIEGKISKDELSQRINHIEESMKKMEPFKYDNQTNNLNNQFNNKIDYISRSKNILNDIIKYSK